MNIDDYLNDNSALNQHLAAIYKEQLRLINENAELRKKLQEWSKDKEIQKAEDKVMDVLRSSLLVLSDIEMDELVKFRESHRQLSMNNRMWLQSLTDRELAERLINCSQEPDYAYNYDEELELWGFIDVYTTSDGSKFDDLDSAIEYETWWLSQEHKIIENGGDEQSESC